MVILHLGSYGNSELDYQPGDHLAVFPGNPSQLVRDVMLRLKNCPQLNDVSQLETQQSLGSWEKQMPPAKFSTLLYRFVDLAGPPSQELLRFLASAAKDSRERSVLLSYIEVFKSNLSLRSNNYRRILRILASTTTGYGNIARM